MQANQTLSAAVADDLPQADPNIGVHADEVVYSGPSVRRSDLAVHIPPRPVAFGSSRSGKGLLQSQDASNGSSSSRGFLRGLSFKKKVTTPDGEKNSLLHSDLKTAPESPVLANFMSAWKRCTSLPVTPASNLSPSTSAPVSARTYSERLKSHIGSVQAPVSRSLSIPGRNLVIVRSVSFAACKEHAHTDTNDAKKVKENGQ